MSGSNRVRVRQAPRLGARVPGWVLRGVLAMVGIVLCLSQLSLGTAGFWAWVGIGITGVAVVFPATPAAWLLMLMLGISVLPRVPSPADPRIYLLIAGIHLLHLIASYARVVPARGWIQLRVFAAPLRRYLLVQLPVQGAALVALAVFAPRIGEHPTAIPALGIVAGIALIGLALVLIVPLILPAARAKRGGVR
jgi:hypothetical protein